MLEDDDVDRIHVSRVWTDMRPLSAREVVAS